MYHVEPDKFPLNLVMFTGLEEFKRDRICPPGRDRRAETILVEASSRPTTLGSTALGFALVGIGLADLVLIVIGSGAHG